MLDDGVAKTAAGTSDATMFVRDISDLDFCNPPMLPLRFVPPMLVLRFILLNEVPLATRFILPNDMLRFKEPVCVSC